jgi:hypothetical protein
LTVFGGRRIIPGADPRRGGREVGVIAVRRLGVIVALGALLGMFGAVVTASPALARGPEWQFQPKSPVILPAEWCGFEVRVTPLVNREYAKILEASDGSMILLATGSVTTSYTNLETGKTITENISGPAKITFFPDGSFTALERGRNELNLLPADAARFGLPTISVTVGRRSISFAPDGSITSVSLQGHIAVDVCAALS